MSAAICREERDLEQVHLVLGFPGVRLSPIPITTPPRCSRPLLGGGMSSRLFQEIREKRGLVYSIYSFATAYQRRRHLRRLCRHRRGRGGGADAGAVRRARASSPTASAGRARARARAQLKAGLLMSLESTTARVRAAGQPHADLRPAARSGRADRAASTRSTTTAVDARGARGCVSGPPTLAALGPIGQVEAYERLAERLRRVSGEPADAASHLLRLRGCSDRRRRPSALDGPARRCCARPSAAIGAAWAELRAASRDFLVPWEPTWPADALTAPAFRRRLRRYAHEWRSDQGYSFLLFRREDDALLGGISLTNVRRGVAETASLGYWIGERFARQGYMSEGLRAHPRLRLRAPAAPSRRGRLPAAQRAEPRGCCSKRLSAKKAMPANICCIDGAWQDHVLFGAACARTGSKSGARRPKAADELRRGRLRPRATASRRRACRWRAAICRRGPRRTRCPRRRATLSQPLAWISASSWPGPQPA